MKKELQYFKIEEAWGGSQEWFSDRMMRLGGCAAVTACDSCIFFDLNRIYAIWNEDETLSPSQVVRY